MIRIFKIDRTKGTLQSTTSAPYIDSPSSEVGMFGGTPDPDEQLHRLFYRVYTLGRADKAREIREALREA